jgi:hypothetical protein
VLHDRQGSAVRDEALDLRPGELGLVLPLVLILVVLSAWPAEISDRALDVRDYTAFFVPEDAG